MSQTEKGSRFGTIFRHVADVLTGRAAEQRTQQEATVWYEQEVTTFQAWWRTIQKSLPSEPGNKMILFLLPEPDFPRTRRTRITATCEPATPGEPLRYRIRLLDIGISLGVGGYGETPASYHSESSYWLTVHDVTCTADGNIRYIFEGGTRISYQSYEDSPEDDLVVAQRLPGAENFALGEMTCATFPQQKARILHKINYIVTPGTTKPPPAEFFGPA